MVTPIQSRPSPLKGACWGGFMVQPKPHTAPNFFSADGCDLNIFPIFALLLKEKPIRIFPKVLT